MLQEFFWLQMEDMALHELWFKQNGATCHTAAETMTLLADKVPKNLISWELEVNWSFRSYDLTPWTENCYLVNRLSWSNDLQRRLATLSWLVIRLTSYSVSTTRMCTFWMKQKTIFWPLLNKYLSSLQAVFFPPSHYFKFGNRKASLVAKSGEHGGWGTHS